MVLDKDSYKFNEDVKKNCEGVPYEKELAEWTLLGKARFPNDVRNFNDWSEKNQDLRKKTPDNVYPFTRILAQTPNSNLILSEHVNTFDDFAKI